jgi:pectin methylesterase-like acyl-CoA thioesterase
MAQQIKKKFIGPDQIDGSKIKLLENQSIRGINSLGQEVDLVKINAQDKVQVLGEEVALKSELDQEIVDRQSGDLALDQKIETEKARIDAILEASDADKDSFKEIVDLINSVDTENDQAFAGYVLSNDERSTQIEQDLSALEDRVDILESTKEIIEVNSIEEAPSIGLEGKVYVTKDSNKIYRWAMVGGGELTFDLVVGSGEVHTTLESAIAAASNGQNILVKAGTYLVSSSIAVNKEVKIVGEDADTVIFETAGTTSDPVNMFVVRANNAALAKMTIKHKKTSNTSVEAAVVASGGGFPQTRISNFIMEQCKIEFVEFGLTVRAEEWCVRDSQFTYATGSVSNSARAIGIYGTKGNAFIKDNFLKNDIINGTSFRPLYLTSTTGSNPNETVEGKLVIEGTTHVGPLAQFFNQENTQSAGAGTFELQIKDNVINETNLFVGVACYVSNAGDLFSSITLSGNTLSNLHAADGGKGIFGVYGNSQFRSSDLIVHASNNTLGQEIYRTGWEAVEGTIVGKELAIPAFTVALDSIIPDSGEAPSISGGSSGQYVELSEQPDLSGIESDILSLDSRLDVLEPKVSTLESEMDQVESDISALDSRVDALEAFGYEQVIHVSKNGLDTNSGKQHSPFLTITAAMNAITDASPTKRYAVKVAAGAYSEPIALKANVFIIGEGQKESVRITGAVSMDSSFSGTADHRSGFSGVTLLSAADFNWATVTSGAGKLYFNEVVFGSTVNMYGHNNAIAQAQFNACIIFGALTISGINVGVFSNNVCYGNINLNQHPNGGMATILVASGGYCQGTITQTAAVNDFNRRSASFLRNFNSEKIVLDGPSVYADVDLISQGKQLPEISNGANLIALNPTINHDITAQMIVPKNTNAHNMGDWGKQWFWNFGYVHASSGTDLFLISYPESYAPDSSGKSIGIYTDGAGLQENVDGGDIELQTAATSGTGVRGKITLDGKEIDVTSKQIKNLADATDASDAVNKSQLDSIVQFNKETKVVDSTILSNEYVDLAFLAKPNSIVMFVGRLAMIEGSDYSVSVVEGVTRVTFLAPMLVPSEEALELDDVIHFTYAK